MTAPAPPCAAPAQIGLSSARLDRLSEVMRAEVARGRVPGAVALIARRGRVGYFECFGQREYYRTLFRDMVYAAFAD